MVAGRMVNVRRMRRMRRKRGKLTTLYKGKYARKYAPQTHSFTRTFLVDTAYSIPVGWIGGGFGRSFQLNDLPNVSEFTSLFDQYRIKGISFKLVPKQGLAIQQGVVTAGGNQAVMPKIYSCIDYDDASAPGSIDEVLQYQNVKISRANQTHKRYFKPAIADELFNTGVTTAYGMRKNTWIDCSYPSVEHYGIRFYIEPSTANTPRWDYDLVCKFYLQFKYVR